MRELGFDHVELAISHGLRYESWLHPPDRAVSRQNCWTVRIPLTEPLEESWMEISRHIDRGEGYLMLHAVVETVREVWPQKISELERSTPAAALAVTEPRP
jgi:hypothetical protein